MDKEVQSLVSWKEILRWNKIPILGPCHCLNSDDDFLKNYLYGDELVRLESNIYDSLESDNRSNIRFIGEPGAGKTSFLYYLKRKYKREKNDYVFYIFHANRADDEAHYRELVQGQIIKAWQCLYKKTDNEDKFNSVDEQNIIRKEKLNILSDYYLDNQDKFNKTLMFVIDDVDLLSDEMAYNISLSVKKDIELASVVKLVSIRPCTFKHYSSKTKSFIEAFFPTTYTLPETSLHEIIKYRVSAISYGKGKCPFSEKLCDDILKILFSGNKRESLSALKAILEHALPKKIKVTDSEQFIQEYIERVSINALIDNGLVPNIHDIHFRSVSQYPVPHDIIQLCCHTKDPHIILGSLNEIASGRSRRTERLVDLEKKYKVRDGELRYSVDKMKEANLITVDSNKFISLTGPGMTLAYYAARKYYNSKCKDITPESEFDEKYWVHMSKNVKYGEVVEAYLLWKARYDT